MSESSAPSRWRTRAARLLLSPILVVAACLIAGVYGALHNQLSYSISPEYFHDLKFAQFGITDTLWNRVGAAWVGWQASWWMGLLLSFPILPVALFAPRARGFAVAFLSACALVVATAALFAFGNLLLSFLVADPVQPWARRPGVEDAEAFSRAGALHNGSYLGGFAGSLLASANAVIHVRRMRKASRDRGAETRT